MKRQRMLLFLLALSMFISGIIIASAADVPTPHPATPSQDTDNTPIAGPTSLNPCCCPTGIFGLSIILLAMIVYRKRQ